MLQSVSTRSDKKNRDASNIRETGRRFEVGLEEQLQNVESQTQSERKRQFQVNKSTALDHVT